MDDDDGGTGLRVDWEKVEAIMIVVGHNLQLFRERIGSVGVCDFGEGSWGRAWEGAVSGSYTSFGRLGGVEEPAAEMDPIDPFGVTGTYLRVSSSCA